MKKFIKTVITLSLVIIIIVLSFIVSYRAIEYQDVSAVCTEYTKIDKAKFEVVYTYENENTETSVVLIKSFEPVIGDKHEFLYSARTNTLSSNEFDLMLLVIILCSILCMLKITGRVPK